MEGPFSAASHHDMLVLLVQMNVLLAAARALGEVARRLKQPAVVGEILAGIILGPSILSSLFPALGTWLVPQTAVQGYLLETVSLIGAMFLLLITGLETDIALIRRHARTAIGVSLGGITTTFASGFLLGQFLPDVLLADPSARLVFSLFVATAMSISAIPVIAKVLMDMNLMRRDIGQTIIAAGMSDDTIGWILLSIVAGLAAGEAITAGSVLQIVGSVIAFLVLSFTLGRLLVKKVMDYVQDELISEDRLLTLVIVMTLAWGAITQVLNLEAVLGAFVMGILFGTMPRLPQSVRHRLESISLAVFTPIFFGVAGLKVNLLQLTSPALIGFALLVIAVATVGKFVGTYLGARVIGRREHWTALSFGAGLNARGAMEIIIATIGLSLGILSQDMFSIIVLMAMSTSLMAPPLLRYILTRVTPEAEEIERLRREELAAGSLVANIRRVLMPIRVRPAANGDDIQTIEARILEIIGKQTPLSITLLTVTPPGQRQEGAEFLRNLSKRIQTGEVVRKVVESDNAQSVILDEVKKDYDLLVLGASDRTRDDETLFTPLVDGLVRMAACPTMIVKGQRVQPDWEPTRILVPTDGAPGARNAADIAFSLAYAPEQEIIVTNIVVELRSDYQYREGARQALAERRLDMARAIVEELRAAGEGRKVKTRGMVEEAPDAAVAIVQMAERYTANLIVLGTDLRPGSSRLYLGPRVEWILENAACPVIVMNAA
jgi:Kef-type K+ transport system membrane component KefB/nucleotide-binding universal stress UspA family protein